MIKINRGLSLSFLIILLIPQSCVTSYSEGFSRKVVDGKFSIALPDYMKETDALREDAILQYSSRYRNLYVVAFESDKSQVGKDFLQYQNDAVKVITQYLDNPIITDSIETTIQGIPAYEAEIFGKIDDQIIYYDLLIINTPEKYFQICTWTRGPERKEKYGSDLKQILYSFELI